MFAFRLLRRLPMRPTLLAVLAICTLTYGTLTAQESPVPKVPPAKIDYSILGQPAHAARVNLTDEQRAKIAEILDTRVNDLRLSCAGGRHTEFRSSFLWLPRPA